MLQLLTAHGLFNIGRAFIGVVLVVYLLQNGISLTTIALAKSLQLFASVLFNYPAGKIADKYGKKTAILCACGFALGYFLLMLSPTSEKVILGEILNGLSIAFYMGAYEAWVFEFKNDKENSFSLISRSAEILLLSSILASVIGALYFEQAIYLAFVFVSLAIPFYYQTPQKPINISADNYSFFAEIKYFLQHIDHKVVFFLLFGGAMQLIYQLWSVFFAQDMGLEKQYLGYILGAMFAGQWLFAFLSRQFKLDKKANANKWVLLGITIFAFVTLLLFFNQMPILMIAISFILFVAFCGLANNLYFSQSCDLFAKQPNESSMISLIDTSVRLIGAILLAVYALLEWHNATWVWLFFPIIIMGYGIIYSICHKRSENL